MTGVLANAINVVQNIPACAALFGTAASRANGFDPAIVLNAFYGNIGTVFASANMVGGKPVSSSFVYDWYLGGMEGAEITGLYISTSGLTWGPRVFINVSNWNSEGRVGALDLKAMSGLLLHEMGHVYNELTPQGSGGSQILDNDRGQPSTDNDQLIYRKCFP